ncbi:Methylmalonyl-CoA carboxyltransferase 12S subunit [bioreactor metagenome]|uniref:Methylmalonyl-CoA carboxyltransferase 12S subunit n=1 Tax=bioreactor metagenome TaxID=1076179 RepID=A0A645CAT9_9ZZZZ
MFDFVIVTGEAKVGISPKDQMGASELVKNGLAHFTAKNDLEVREQIEKIFRYMPSNNCKEQDLSKVSFGAENVDITKYIPEEMDKQSDMAQIIKTIADEGTCLEYLKEYCGSMTCAFAKLNGITAGIIANNSSYTENGIVKASRFINLCDNYDIPLVTLVDNPGYAKSAYQAGMAANLSKLVSSYAMATSVKITVLIKKAVGAGYTCMCPKELGADVCVALPCAVISLDTLSKENANLDESKYFENFCSPYQAAKLGLIDDVIMPEKLKDIITKSIKAMYSKREEKLLKKHINTPL